MPTIKLTSKRQATFPVEMCLALNLKAGDEVELQPMTINSEMVWVLKPKNKTSPSRSWIGSLKKHAVKVQDHSLEAIRESIGKGWADKSRH